MKLSNFTLYILSLLVVLGIITGFYIWGIPKVPFHPDESTYLYMSSDVELLIQNPSSLTWRPDKEHDLKQHYRTIDAPLTRYLLGVGRLLVGAQVLLTDWDWGKTWDENQSTGAMPGDGLLLIGRVTMALLIPISLVLIYLVGRQIAGRYTGILAAVFLGMNALILLHNRRAMAESVLTVTTLFAVWSFLQAGRRPWLAGLAMALAFNAKHSALALFPVGLIAVSWLPADLNNRIRRGIRGALIFTLVFGVVTLLLNPYLWRYPLDAIKATWVGRQTLLERQLANTKRLAPEQVLESPTERAVVMVANVYFMPPSFAEVGNYLEQTFEMEQEYLSIPAHSLFRGLLGGVIMLTLTIGGIILGISELRKSQTNNQRKLILLLLATSIQFSLMVFTIPLPWQRYSIPLIPYASLWAAYAIGYWFDSGKVNIGIVSASISERT